MSLGTTVKNLIDKLGKIPFTISKTTQGDYQSGGTGDYTDGTTTTVSGLCVPVTYLARFIDGVRIKAGDIEIYVSADTLGSFEPEPNDVVTLGGNEYTVQTAQRTVFKGEDVLWQCQLRRRT